MKVTFFNGSVTTTTTTAPQIISAPILPESVEAAARQAAAQAAADAAPAAADAIRAQVAVDADRAQQAADALAADREKIQQVHSDNLSNIPHVVEQMDEAIPARPAGYRWCYWHCWDSPKAKMSARDIWIKRDPPEVPDGITRANFKLLDQLDGTLRINVNGLPDEHPPLLGVDYRIDAETTWRPTGLTGNGTFTTHALPAGSHTLEIASRNFKGHSAPNQIYAFDIRTDGTLPTLSYPGTTGNLADQDHWLASATSLIIDKGRIQNSTRATVKWNYLDVPLGTSFFVEATLAMIPNSTRVDIKIGAERLCLRVAPGGVWSLDAGTTRLLSGTSPALITSGRVEITPTSARAFVNGTLVGEVGHAVNLTGVLGGVGWYNASQDSTWGSIMSQTEISTVRAGRLV